MVIDGGDVSVDLLVFVMKVRMLLMFMVVLIKLVVFNVDGNDLPRCCVDNGLWRSSRWWLMVVLISQNVLILVVVLMLVMMIVLVLMLFEEYFLDVSGGF